MTTWWQDREKLVKALTLTTPELTEERNKLEIEETRKERVRNALVNLLPWETGEEESKILEEECRESILALSLKEESFLKSPLDENPEAKAFLPLVVLNFDLDAHVGLIQRLLEVDENLVIMQSELGGGENEFEFWCNYFQRCAIIRKKVGMNVDEIWSESLVNQTLKQPANQDPSLFSNASINNVQKSLESFTNSAVTAATASKFGGFMSSVLPPIRQNISPKETSGEQSKQKEEKKIDTVKTSESEPPPSSSDDSFEVIQKNKKGEEDLDDLAAEIAKELEV